MVDHRAFLGTQKMFSGGVVVRVLWVYSLIGPGFQLFTELLEGV